MWTTDDNTCPSCRRSGSWHGVITEPGERERFACDECGHVENFGGCADCGKSLPKARKAALCADCKDIRRDAELMDSGDWLPIGGLLRFMPADVAS